MEKGKARDYLCTTGQAQGDKQVRGDLKTPEGVYFVVRKRTERLDFEEYGGEAYILDYPNPPVGWLRGKTAIGDGFCAGTCRGHKGGRAPRKPGIRACPS